MRGFISQLNRSADAGEWSCVLDLLEVWARADALMGAIAGYQGYYERSWAGTDFALAIRCDGELHVLFFLGLWDVLTRRLLSSSSSNPARHGCNRAVDPAGLGGISALAAI
jgi:hypothetical protein